MRLQDKLISYLEYCTYRKELDQKTVKAYRIDLNQYFTFVACEEPDKEKIEEYITELHKKYKQKTVKRKIASVKAYYSYLEENELIKESPFRKIKVKFKENLILPRIIPREEIEHLLNHMYGCLQQASETVYKYCLRDVAVIELFFATGARVYEISNIRAENVNLNTGLIQLMGKGAKERYVQIGHPLDSCPEGCLAAHLDAPRFLRMLDLGKVRLNIRDVAQCDGDGVAHVVADTHTI